jgi:hypothetical protein
VLIAMHLTVGFVLIVGFTGLLPSPTDQRLVLQR